MVKAVIFDLDGTLAYTYQDIRDSIDELRGEYGLGPVPDGLMQSVVNLVIEDIVLYVLEGKIGTDGIPLAVAKYNSIYERRYLCKTAPYEGLPDTLAALKREGVRLGVYSNKTEAYVKDIINSIYDGSLFDFLKGPDGIKPKPDPMGALLLAQWWGISPSEIAYVGDSVLDVRTGKAAEMTVIGAAWGYTDSDVLKNEGADYVIKSTKELLPLLEKLGTCK